jgi:predicted acylesterase/phospholipase RssA/CRP-like cAMP-binding protein
VNTSATKPGSAQSAAFLGQVPVLAGLDEELLGGLASQLREVKVAAGEWLFRQGEIGESLFVLRSGRLEVVDEGPPEAVIRKLRRGDVLGELALLRDEVRSASVRARRDSELFELDREQFERLIAEEPGFAVGLTRSIGAQLAASRTPVTTAHLPRTITILALDPGAPVAEAADLLATSLRRHGSVGVLAGDPDRKPEAMASELDSAESAEDRVLLVGTSSAPGDEWTDFCLREADVVLALSRGAPGQAWLDHPEALQGCELVVIGAPARPEVIESLRPREVQVIAGSEDFDRCLDAGARRLAGKAVGIILSGGGARAFAHLGVIEELHAAGAVIDRVGGVSLGAVVGAGISMGHSPDELHELFRVGFIDTNPTGDYVLPFYSVIRGKRTRELLQGFIGERRFEELPTRFFCLSCDLNSREVVLHRTGPMLEAVTASIAIPGVFPAVSTADGRLLVDGGVLDNLPVSAMARTGEGPVIAVDVTSTVGFKKSGRPGIARMGRPVRRYLTGSEAELPRLSETIIRSVTVGSVDTAEAAKRHADLVILPELEGVGMLDWRRLDQVREAGRAAARAALEEAPAWLTAGSGR